jgi:hypothetical protein
MLFNALEFDMNVRERSTAAWGSIATGSLIRVADRSPYGAGFFDRGNQIHVLDDWSSLVGGGQGFPRDPATSADPRRDGDALTI